MLESINAHFTENIQTQIAAADTLAKPIAKASMMLVQALLNGNKILCCGNGSSAANAQHFASCLLNKFETERPSLPAFALSADSVALAAIANNHPHDDIYSKQIRALGHDGDVLLVFCTCGNNKDIVKAMEAAVNRNMVIIALTGSDGGEIAKLLGHQDIEIRIPSVRTARIQEGHMVILHTLCDLIDQNLFPKHGE